MSPKKLVVILIVVVGLGFAAWLWLGRPPEPDTELLASGTVEATEARLGFQASGRIEAILVREGDAVAAGAEIARLERAELEARRAEATAQLAAARAQLAELERGFRSEEIAQARAAVAAARERLGDAERDVERAQTLFEGGAVSREAYDKAAVALEVAQSQLTEAEERSLLLERGPRREQIEAQRAAVARAEAAVGVADALLANSVVTAPFPGVVTVRHREPGEAVAPGSPVVTLLNPADRWVRIYVPEDRIGAVALGGRAEILADTFPGKRYPGEVFFLAAEAEFTPKAVQTQEERVRLVYAVKVRVLEDPGYELKAGMPVDVALDLGDGGSSAG